MVYGDDRCLFVFLIFYVIGFMDLNLVILSKFSLSLKKKKKNCNSYIILSDITRELRISPLPAIYAISQLCCFRKWKNSSCIINHLTNNIPSMSHYS